ncbi:DUF6069 family protein [Actinoallomurus sp. NBC_01490]
MQLELRGGEPEPVLGLDAGFWLRGTGVRALRNPGRRTASTFSRPGPVPSHAGQHTPYASHRASHTHRFRGLVGTGFVATLAAMVATTLAAALAQAVGVDFEVPDGGESIPLSGFAVVTGFFSVVGIAIAVALLRWSARPAARFVWTAVSLTAISLVPPLLSGANTATTSALLGLHLVPATVMIPTLTRSLPGWPGRVRRRRR